MPLPDPAERPLLTISEAADALGLSRSRAYEAAKRGDLPTVTLAGRLLVPTEALLAMLSGRPTPVADTP